MPEKSIQLNGEEKFVTASTVADLLAELSLTNRKIAIERNRIVVPKSAYESTEVLSGDQIEVVTFVGGG